MMTWSLVPVGSSTMGPTLGTMATMMGTRAAVGVATTMIGMCRTRTTATATSPGY